MILIEQMAPSTGIGAAVAVVCHSRSIGSRPIDWNNSAFPAWPPSLAWSASLR